MSEDEEHQTDEPEEEAAVLPAREAMQLITADTPAPGFIPGSAKENVTSDDREEHHSNQDSASSQT